jgi:uncharacterized integral membrane protein (TIGR02327 family)
MSEKIVTYLIYMICFGLSFYALSGLDFAKLLRAGNTRKAWLLLILLSMALGYLCACFLTALSLRGM